MSLNSVAIVAMTDSEFHEWTPAMKGYLLGAFYYGYAAMQIPAGIIIKRVPAHRAYGAAVFVSAALTALSPFVAQWYYVLLTFRLVMGVFQAAAVPCILSFMTKWAPASERCRMTQICVSGAFFGTVLVLPASGVVGAVFGWEWIFYSSALFSLVWVVS